MGKQRKNFRLTFWDSLFCLPWTNEIPKNNITFNRLFKPLTKSKFHSKLRINPYPPTFKEPPSFTYKPMITVPSPFSASQTMVALMRVQSSLHSAQCNKRSRHPQPPLIPAFRNVSDSAVPGIDNDL